MRPLLWLSDLSNIVDASGAYGSLFHYGLVITFVGGAFIIFIQLWRKGRLDMDESPKFQMMEVEPDLHSKEKADAK